MVQIVLDKGGFSACGCIAVHILIVNILFEFVYQIHTFQLNSGILKQYQASPSVILCATVIWK